MNFHVVAGHSVARDCELSDVYAALADGFREARVALNHLSDSLINLDDDRHAGVALLG